MDKKEFFDLLEKYKKGECTALEQKLLFKFCDDTQLNDITSKWSLSEEEETRIRILRNIHKRMSAEKRTSIPNRRFNVWKIAATVSVLIGLGLTLLYLNESKYDHAIPEDTITLEMDNGELKVIEDEASGRITNQEGKFLATQNGGKLVYDAVNEVPELQYNTLSVPYGKRFDIVLSDGTTVFLNAGSSIKYPVQFLPGNQRRVFLTGEAFLEVAKDEKHPFVVNADELNVQVLGTKFNVQAYQEDRNTEVVLVEGLVALHTNEESNLVREPIMLNPGHKASFNRMDKTIATDPVTTSIYTSWMKGELVFRNMTFENILKKLERHYNVDIENTNSELSQKRFNASFGKATLQEVLNELGENFGVGHTLDGNKIIIK